MPIGPFEDFAALKAHLSAKRKGKPLPDERMNAITAAVAERIRPGWHEEAARARKKEK